MQSYKSSSFKKGWWWFLTLTKSTVAKLEAQNGIPIWRNLDESKVWDDWVNESFCACTRIKELVNCDKWINELISASDRNVPIRPLPPPNNKGSTPSKPGTSFELEWDEPVSKRPAGGTRRESAGGGIPERADEFESQSFAAWPKPGFFVVQNWTCR